MDCKSWILSNKVHIFWEGHNFFPNLHRRFVLCPSQIYSAVEFCKILRPSQNIWTFFATLEGHSNFLVSDSKLHNIAYILSYYYSNIIFDACYLLAYYDKMVILRVNVCNFVSSVHNIYIQNTTINNKLGAFQ